MIYINIRIFFHIYTLQNSVVYIIRYTRIRKQEIKTLLVKNTSIICLFIWFCYNIYIMAFFQPFAKNIFQIWIINMTFCNSWFIILSICQQYTFRFSRNNIFSCRQYISIISFLNTTKQGKYLPCFLLYGITFYRIEVLCCSRQRRYHI